VMLDYSQENFSAKEKIMILFKEYDTLRAEAISRSGGGYQVIAIFAGLIAAILAWGATHPPVATFWAAVGTLILAAIFSAFLVLRDIYAIARRVAEIERAINHLAGDQELLIWESKRGSAASGLLLRRRYL